MVNQTNCTEVKAFATIRESSSGIKAEITKLVQDLGQSQDLQRDEIIEKWRLANEEDMSTILRQLTLRLDAGRENRAKERILSTLYFTQIRERREQIHSAHKHTFQWIFKPRLRRCADDRTSQHDFCSWLKGLNTSTSLYWVSGKRDQAKALY
jgi:hypothetical protein